MSPEVDVPGTQDTLALNPWIQRAVHTRATP